MARPMTQSKRSSNNNMNINMNKMNASYYKDKNTSNHSPNQSQFFANSF